MSMEAYAVRPSCNAAELSCCSSNNGNRILQEALLCSDMRVTVTLLHKISFVDSASSMEVSVKAQNVRCTFLKKAPVQGQHLIPSCLQLRIVPDPAFRADKHGLTLSASTANVAADRVRAGNVQGSAANHGVVSVGASLSWSLRDTITPWRVEQREGHSGNGVLSLSLRHPHSGVRVVSLKTTGGVSSSCSPRSPFRDPQRAPNSPLDDDGGVCFGPGVCDHVFMWVINNDRRQWLGRILRFRVHVLVCLSFLPSSSSNKMSVAPCFHFWKQFCAPLEFEAVPTQWRTDPV